MRHVLIYLNLVANWHFSKWRGFRHEYKGRTNENGLQVLYALNTTIIRQGLTTEKNNDREGLQFLRPKEGGERRLYSEYILKHLFISFLVK